MLLQIPSLRKIGGKITKRFPKHRAPTANGMSFRGCLSEGVDIFLKSVEHQGESGHDVRVSRLTPWMASVGGPVIMRTTYSLFVENSHPETLHRGRMFRPLWAFVDSTNFQVSKTSIVLPGK